MDDLYVCAAILTGQSDGSERAQILHTGSRDECQSLSDATDALGGVYVIEPRDQQYAANIVVAPKDEFEALLASD